MKTFARSALVVALAVGCGTAPPADGILDHRAVLPPEPAADEGILLVQPEMVLAAGEERMTCWVPDWVPDRDYRVSGMTGFQGIGGHHVVALTAAIPVAAGDVFDCTSLASLTGFRPLILPDPPEGQLVPEGFHVRLPAGSHIVIQSHYINYESSPIRVRDGALFEFAPDGPSSVEVGYLIMNDASVNLAPRSPTTSQFDCVPPGTTPLNVLAIFGHMHEYGTSFSVEHTRAGTTSTIYETPVWDPSFRDEPPITRFDPSGAPMMLMPGDSLRMNCAWENMTADEIHFPSEMCTTVMYYYPALPGDDRIIICER
jgi:hypothetical protein